MENKIKHSGVVESVNDGCVSVKIIQSSACAICKAAKQCHASESKEKIIEVFTKNSKNFNIGQKVTVMASYNVGLIAVTLGMIIPMFLIILVLFVLTSLNIDEIYAALYSLSVMISYYAFLFIFRNRINRKVAFYIE